MSSEHALIRESVPIGPAAAYVGVAVDTMRRWTRSGKVKAIRTPGGQFRYYLTDLDELMVARTHGDDDERGNQ